VKLHFAYAVPPELSRLTRWRNELILRLQAHGLPTPAPSWRHMFPQAHAPLSAPDSITDQVYRALSKHVPTLLYDWREQVLPELGPADILLGHPHPRDGTVIRRAMQCGAPCRLQALMLPVHHGLPHMNRQFADLVSRADIVFGIMGKYWYDTLEMSEFADWKSKITRLDMAIDASHYPYLKRGFNPPGKRGYLYIGRNSIEKGTDLLSRAFDLMGDYPRGWIGSGPEIPGVPRISNWRQLTPAFMASVAAKFDFLVNFSISDANPTTILEAMAWGLPVACTPESGYYNERSILPLSKDDVEASVRTLRWLQSAPEEVLVDLSLSNRKLVEQHYTWARFTTTIWSTTARAAGLGNVSLPDSDSAEMRGATTGGR
jgi:glycosyltransferase involved in cell wall biosynthesis